MLGRGATFLRSHHLSELALATPVGWAAMQPCSGSSIAIVRRLQQAAIAITRIATAGPELRRFALTRGAVGLRERDCQRRFSIGFPTRAGVRFLVAAQPLWPSGHVDHPVRRTRREAPL